MLKPGDAGGSAFLKVDPAYLQHWQQLFPQSSQLKSSGALAQLQPPERAEPPADSLRQRPASLSSASSSSSSSTPSSSATSSCVAAAAASLAGLTSLPVTQLPVFGPLPSSEPPAGGAPAALQGKDLCGAAGGKCGAARFRCTAEELDYYLYGQQRMEIIPLNQHTSDPNNHIPPRRTKRVSRFHPVSPNLLFPRASSSSPGHTDFLPHHPPSIPSSNNPVGLLILSGETPANLDGAFGFSEGSREAGGSHGNGEKLEGCRFSLLERLSTARRRAAALGRGMGGGFPSDTRLDSQISMNRA